MKVGIYVSKNGLSRRGRGFALVRHPQSLPLNETWTYLRSGDTSEFDLPEAIVEEIERRGIWSQTAESESGPAPEHLGWRDRSRNLSVKR